jgi:Flp pilus assembly protein TadG
LRIGRFDSAQDGNAASIARDRSGTVAIEFALLAIPLFLLLFGILETGLIFFGSSALEKATADAARLVRTGQVQAANMTAAQYHDYICGQVSVLLSCGTNLQVDVEAFSNFNGVAISDPIQNGALDPNLNNFNVGVAGNVVLVRTFYTWDILTPILKPFFANLAGGQRLLTSTAAFRNEPF